MTEQQIWFLMIFSLPFLPAVVIFFLIKPQHGDADVIGGIPFFPGLRVKLAGAIATYLVIVVLALVAYQIIVKDETIALILEPVDRAGGRLDYASVNFDRAGAPIVHVEPLGDPNAGQTTLSAFELTREPFLFRSEKSLMLSRDRRNTLLRVLVGGGSLFVPAEYQAVAKEDVIVVSAAVQEDFMADWIALVNYVSIDIIPSKDVARIRQTFLVKDGSERGLTKMDFGVYSVSGLLRAELQIDKVAPEGWQGLEDRLDTVFDRQTAAGLGEDLTGLLKEVENHTRFIDRSVWPDTLEKPLEARVVGSESAVGPSVARFLFAPAPRIHLEAASPGTIYLVRLTGEIAVPDADERIDLPLVFDMKFPTKRYVSTATLLGGTEMRFRAVEPLKILSSGNAMPIARERAISQPAFLLVWAMDLPKLSRVTMPILVDDG